MQQKLIKLQGEIGKSTIIVGNINTPFSEMDRYIRQKISKNIVKFNSTNNHLDIINIYRLLHPTKIRVYILLKLTQNIHQERSHSETQTTP